MNTEGVRATIDVTSSQKGIEETIKMIQTMKKEIDSLDPSTIKLATSVAKLNTQVQKSETEAAKSALQWAKEENQLIKNSAAKEQNALKTEKLRLQVEKMSSSVNKSSSILSLSSFKLAAIGVNFSNMIRVGKKLGQVTQELIQNSADYIETQNLFQVSMGKTTNQATEFVNEMSKAFNLNDKTLKNAVGTFNLMATQMGLTNEQGLIFSETLTKLAVDTSSLRNTDVETALTKLRAGISGQVKPLREWGIDITESTLKQEALANGITKSTSQMSYGEKSILRYSAILRQTTADQGDYARTLESPAQLLKQIREQIQALGIAIGNVLLPMLYKTLTPLLSIVMVLKEIFVWLGTLFKLSTNFGDTSANTALNIAEDTEDALAGAVKNAKELKKWLGGYDELNNVNPSTSANTGGVGTGASIGIDPEFLKLLTTYDNKMGEVANKAAEVRDRILEWLGFTINENGEIVKLNDGMTNFELIVGAIGTLMGTWAIFKIIPIIGVIIKGIDYIKIGLEGAVKLIAGLSNLTGFTGVLKGVAEAIQAYQLGLGSIGEVFKAFVAGPLKAFAVQLAGIAAIIIGIIETIKGIKAIIDGEIVQGILKVAEGIALIVAGVAFLTGNLIPALIALGVAWRLFVAQLIIEHWEEISSLITNIWNWFNDTIITPISDFIMSVAGWVYDNIIQPIIEFFVPIMETLEETFNFIYDTVYDIVDTIWTNIKIFMDKMWEILSTIVQIVVAINKAIVDYVVKPVLEFFINAGKWIYEHIIEPTINFFKSVGEWLYEHVIKPAKDLAVEIANWIKEKVIDPIFSWITTVRDKAREMFQKIVEFVVTFISDQFKAILNSVLAAAESSINGFIGMLNKAVDIINKIPGVEINHVEEVSFKRFDSGGIPALGSVFIAGEGKSTEFVGDIGGRTNVVNEKQLEAALYSALMRANSQNTNNEQPVNEIYIGGNKTDTILARRRLRRQNMTGKAVA